VATDSVLDFQVTLLFVASSGNTVAISLATSPSTNSNLSLSNVTLVTGIAFLVTVTSQVAVLLPSSVVTVIVAIPGAFAVTFPF